MIKSAICEMLGIEYPVFQGGMAWIADGKLAAAVSDGGGLGIIAAGNAPGDYVREQIQAARRITDKPVGVNIKEWLAAGIRVIPVVASVAMAKLMTRLGASALIAEGGESGGHVGELTTMVLVPQICDATTLPVIAAGGICDGRGAAAAFMLGAEGVQVGTRFITATECTAHENYKDKLVKATDISTIVTGKSQGHPVRSLKTPFSRNFAKMETDPNVTPEEILAFGGGALRKAVQEGDENGSYMAGECAGLIKQVEPAAAIVEDIILGAEKVMRERMEKLL